jgi:hypothetical protein
VGVALGGLVVLGMVTGWHAWNASSASYYCADHDGLHGERTGVGWAKPYWCDYTAGKPAGTSIGCQ